MCTLYKKSCIEIIQDVWFVCGLYFQINMNIQINGTLANIQILTDLQNFFELTIIRTTNIWLNSSPTQHSDKNEMIFGPSIKIIILMQCITSTPLSSQKEIFEYLNFSKGVFPLCNLFYSLKLNKLRLPAFHFCHMNM